MGPDETLRHEARTVGDLKKAGYRVLPTREEMRVNLLRMLATREQILPGIIGYEDSPFAKPFKIICRLFLFFYIHLTLFLCTI